MAENLGAVTLQINFNPKDSDLNRMERGINKRFDKMATRNSKAFGSALKTTIGGVLAGITIGSLVNLATRKMGDAKSGMEQVLARADDASTQATNLNLRTASGEVDALRYYKLQKTAEAYNIDSQKLNVALDKIAKNFAVGEKLEKSIPSVDPSLLKNKNKDGVFEYQGGFYNEEGKAVKSDGRALDALDNFEGVLKALYKQTPEQRVKTAEQLGLTSRYFNDFKELINVAGTKGLSQTTDELFKGLNRGGYDSKTGKFVKNASLSEQELNRQLNRAGELEQQRTNLRVRRDITSDATMMGLADNRNYFTNEDKYLAAVNKSINDTASHLGSSLKVQEKIEKATNAISQSINELNSYVLGGNLKEDAKGRSAMLLGGGRFGGIGITASAKAK
ncbi:MAG: hypothetical protein CMF19_09360 [Idiomarinaceae bacterium]|nr:hypothetical protein [Idiomarinaceae bacterium]